MANSVTRADVYAALLQKSGLEVLQEKETDKQLRIMGRSPVERWPFFLPVIDRLLRVSDTPGGAWTCDISKQYMRRNDKVLYAWRLIFQAPTGLAAQYENIASVIRSAPAPSRVEVTSMLLPGHKKGQIRGGVDAKGKGASKAGTLPMAITRGGQRVT